MMELTEGLLLSVQGYSLRLFSFIFGTLVCIFSAILNVCLNKSRSFLVFYT